jgi:hypothetical protein
MSNTEPNELVRCLEQGAATLRDAGLPGELAGRLAHLAAKVEQPCVLAVVGRMKAGKSTFINALLGQDVAKVGVTETTATINRFCYGTPADPQRPVRCRWRGGRYEDVSRDFLDSLQGNDAESLRRAERIDCLEYLLPNALLHDVTLVDTPGTAAVVDEHQNRTAEFLNLQRQLRDRHGQDTQRIGSDADAVIYLIGQVPRATDQAFLEEFGQATGGQARALNAIGVLAKIDLQPEILARRTELAGKIARQLQANLNTVVPVSAGLHQASLGLRAQDHRGLLRLIAGLRQIPPRRLDKLLDSDELYEMDFDDCPITVDERRALRGDMPWTVFTTIARLAADPDLDAAAIAGRLDELAGFTPLREVLERHFFKRARFLRSYAVLNDARKLLSDVRFRHLPEFRKRDRADSARRARFLGFLGAAQGDPAIAKELAEFVGLQCGSTGQGDALEAAIKELDRKLGRLFHALEEHNADFEALEQLQKNPQPFAADELDELRCLLGLYGVETEKRLVRGQPTAEYAAQRQQTWADIRVRTRDATRLRLAERAEARYGLIVYELTSGLADADR